MMRTCNGRDPWVRSERTPAATPCTCGLTFDENTRSLVYPHVFIPTRADLARMAAMGDSIAVEPVRA